MSGSTLYDYIHLICQDLLYMTGSTSYVRIHFVRLDPLYSTGSSLYDRIHIVLLDPPQMVRSTSCSYTHLLWPDLPFMQCNKLYCLFLLQMSFGRVLLAKVEKCTLHCRPISRSSSLESKMYIINVLLMQIHVMNTNILVKF